MFWREQKITYDILIPPFDKNPQEFNSGETREYFDWYMEHIPKRICYLSQRSRCNLDMSFYSLIDLWKWFLKIAEIEKTPEDRLDAMRNELSHHSKFFIDQVISESEVQFSLQTEYILRDIAMYVGEVFVRYSEKITWGYHTDLDKDSFANLPLLQGFEDHDFTPPFPMEFEPIHMVSVQASNLFDGDQNSRDLYNLCQQWIDFIPK